MAQTLHAKADVLERQGDYPSALALYDRALSIKESCLGAHHPSLAATLASKANVLQRQGDYPSALALIDRALSIDESCLGAHHPDVATTLLNNATIFLKPDFFDPKRALPLLERTMSIRHAWDAQHADTKNCYNWLLQASRALKLPVRRCDACRQPSTRLEACARCNAVHYCDRACQVRHGLLAIEIAR